MSKVFSTNRHIVNDERGFSLIELLVVVAVIAVLAGLLMVGASAARAKARRTVCLNNLDQFGKAMTMYVSDNGKYPPRMGGPPFDTWAGLLARYTGTSWTNASFNCPSYLAEGGLVEWKPPPPEGGKFTARTSYSYNAHGMQGWDLAGTEIISKGLPLGLADYNGKVSELQVVAPSEMYAVGDARPFLLRPAGVDVWIGQPMMEPWKLSFGIGVQEAPPPHGDAYNLLFADGHVNTVKRKDYLYPPRAAQHWNRDNQPHPEMWSAPGDWAVTNY